MVWGNAIHHGREGIVVGAWGGWLHHIYSQDAEMNVSDELASSLIPFYSVWSCSLSDDAIPYSEALLCLTITDMPRGMSPWQVKTQSSWRWRWTVTIPEGLRRDQQQKEKRNCNLWNEIVPRNATVLPFRQTLECISCARWNKNPTFHSLLICWYRKWGISQFGYQILYVCGKWADKMGQLDQGNICPSPYP